METKWHSDEILAITGGELHGESFTAAGVSIDTRSLQQGEMFIALTGEHTDGHRFLAQAQKAGAAGALVSRIPDNAPENFPLIVVHQVAMALEELGRAARARSTASIIGITGSVGKTSAKEMLKLALTPYGKVYATTGNLNNHLGVPITLANMPRDAKFAIIEMGMNHAGEIDFLSRIAQPHIGLITTVEAVHLEFFESVEGIARAKSEIFVGMNEGSPAVLNADNLYYPLMVQLAEEQGLRVVSFGESAQAEFRVQQAACTVQGTEVHYIAKGAARQFRLSSLGTHWPRLAVALLAVVDALELPLEKAEAALAAFAEAEGRGKITRLPWKNGEITLIDDAYNASPVSMRGALEKLGMLTPEGQGRRVAVLGEMRELGAESARFHEELRAVIQAHHIDRVLLTGHWMEYLNAVLPKDKKAGYTAEAENLTPALFAEIQAGDVVLFKGSHGSEVYQLVAAMKAQANHLKVKHAL